MITYQSQRKGQRNGEGSKPSPSINRRNRPRIPTLNEYLEPALSGFYILPNLPGTISNRSGGMLPSHPAGRNCEKQQRRVNNGDNERQAFLPLLGGAKKAPPLIRWGLSPS